MDKKTLHILKNIQMYFDLSADEILSLYLSNKHKLDFALDFDNFIFNIMLENMIGYIRK